MRIFLLTFLIVALSPLKLFAIGENCSSPVSVTVCPAVSFPGQTSVGKGNDVGSWRINSYSNQTTTGEDLVYEITYPAGSTDLQVSIMYANKSGLLFISPTCAINSSTIYTSKSFYAGNNANLSIPVSPSATSVYLYVDHIGSSTLNFDISFGIATKVTQIVIPDKRGKLEYAKVKCISPQFREDFGLTIDGVVKTPPTSFGTVNQPHDYCFDVYFQNLTGIEGVKAITFTFMGFSTVSAPVSNVSGFYSTGSWNAVVSGNNVIWTYNNTSNTEKGDYDDVTKSCLKYSFCMKATPLSTTSYFKLWIDGDGQTPGYNGYQYTGCCAAGACAAYGASGSSLKAAATAFGTGGNAGFGSSAGPSGLPLTFLDIWTEQQDDRFTLNWETTDEYNLSHFIPQISKDGVEFEDISNVYISATGNNVINTYTTILNGYLSNHYFRVKSVDIDGTEQFSKLIGASDLSLPLAELIVSPNPAQDYLRVQSSLLPIAYTLYDLKGNRVSDQPLNSYDYELGFYIDLSSFEKGMYTLQVFTKEGVQSTRVMKE